MRLLIHRKETNSKVPKYELKDNMNCSEFLYENENCINLYKYDKYFLISDN